MGVFFYINSYLAVNFNNKLIKEKEENESLYIAYDNNGLTIGLIDHKKNIKVWDRIEKAKEINFIHFSNDKTFSLINREKMEHIVSEIFSEIEEKIPSLKNKITEKSAS